jgi:hypothetical protein
VERPTLKLAFLRPPHLPIFTGSKIEDINGNPLEIVLVDVETGLPAALPHALRVELVPVFGDFPLDDSETWSAEDFNKNIVKEREGKRPLLTGEVSHTMRDGRGVAVNELQFTDNSSWVRCRRFRIGVRVVPGGVRVLEAMTEAFIVRDHRGELYRKHYPPVLGDDVWRLEKIGKEGAFHRKLALHGVKNVQEFLRMLTVKPDELRVVGFSSFFQPALQHLVPPRAGFLISLLCFFLSGTDTGRRHDRPHVGGDDDPREDLRPRRQGVRVQRGARHRLRRLRLQPRQG